MWIVNFFREAKAWRIVRGVCKKHTKELASLGLKYDWFGRIYKVINRDVDIELGSEEDQVYLQNELAKIWNLVVRLKIADILAYELRPLEDSEEKEDGTIEYEHGYLITLTPAYNLDKQYVSIKTVSLLIIGLLSLIGCVLYFVLPYVTK